jgi:hypothetical protein
VSGKPGQVTPLRVLSLNTTLDGMDWRSVFCRYCLIVYWAFFVVLALRQAEYPGLMLEPERWRYPWAAVPVVAVLLAALVAGLHVILRPATYHRSWGRLLGAVAYSAVLVALASFTVATDLPGIAYVPAYFAVVTFAGVLVFALVQVAAALWRTWTHVSNRQDR